VNMHEPPTVVVYLRAHQHSDVRQRAKMIECTCLDSNEGSIVSDRSRPLELYVHEATAWMRTVRDLH
jgi:hypothetical protein